MDWFTTAAIVLAVVAWSAGLLVAAALSRGSREPAPTVLYSWLLAVAMGAGGLFFSAIAAPDWSPVTMVLVFAPFWTVTVWAVLFARFVSRAARYETASKRATLFAVASILVTPLGVLLLVVFGLPLVVLVAVLIGRGQYKRAGQLAR